MGVRVASGHGALWGCARRCSSTRRPRRPPIRSRCSLGVCPTGVEVWRPALRLAPPAAEAMSGRQQWTALRCWRAAARGHDGPPGSTARAVRAVSAVAVARFPGVVGPPVRSGPRGWYRRRLPTLARFGAAVTGCARRAAPGPVAGRASGRGRCRRRSGGPLGVAQARAVPCHGDVRKVSEPSAGVVRMITCARAPPGRRVGEPLRAVGFRQGVGRCLGKAWGVGAGAGRGVLGRGPVGVHAVVGAARCRKDAGRRRGGLQVALGAA